MNETENQAVDAFVSVFETEAAKRSIPKKLAACGAIFTIGAHQRVGLKILLSAPTGSGKTMLLKHFVFPLTGVKGEVILGFTPRKLRDHLSRIETEGCATFVFDAAEILPEKCDPILAEWGGNILLCGGTRLAEWGGGVLLCEETHRFRYIGGKRFPGFVRVAVSQEEGKHGNVCLRGGEVPDISGLRERLEKLPAVDKDSLLKRAWEL